MSKKLTEEQKRKNLADEVVKLRREGKVIISDIEGFSVYAVKDLVDNQPVDGLLYDLNRDMVTCASWIENSDNIVWVNNFASGVVIEYLHNDRAALQKKYDLLLSNLQKAVEEIEKEHRETLFTNTGDAIVYRVGLSDALNIIRKHVKEVKE